MQKEHTGGQPAVNIVARKRRTLSKMHTASCRCLCHTTALTKAVYDFLLLHHQK